MSLVSASYAKSPYYLVRNMQSARLLRVAQSRTEVMGQPSKGEGLVVAFLEHVDDLQPELRIQRGHARYLVGS